MPNKIPIILTDNNDPKRTKIPILDLFGNNTVTASGSKTTGKSSSQVRFIAFYIIYYYLLHFI